MFVFMINFCGIRLTACSIVFDFFLGGTNDSVPLWIVYDNFFQSKFLFSSHIFVHRISMYNYSFVCLKYSNFMYASIFPCMFIAIESL